MTSCLEEFAVALEGCAIMGWVFFGFYHATQAGSLAHHDKYVATKVTERFEVIRSCDMFLVCTQSIYFPISTEHKTLSRRMRARVFNVSCLTGLIALIYWHVLWCTRLHTIETSTFVNEGTSNLQFGHNFHTKAISAADELSSRRDVLGYKLSISIRSIQSFSLCIYTASGRTIIILIESW